MIRNNHTYFNYKQDSLGEIDDTKSFLRKFLAYLELDEDIDQLTNRLTEDILKNGIELVPGVQKLINHLIDNNIPMAIATNVNESLIKALFISTNGLDHKCFTHYICGGDDPEVKTNKRLRSTFRNSPEICG